MKITTLMCAAALSLGATTASYSATTDYTHDFTDFSITFHGLDDNGTSTPIGFTVDGVFDTYKYTGIAPPYVSFGQSVTNMFTFLNGNLVDAEFYVTPEAQAALPP